MYFGPLILLYWVYSRDMVIHTKVCIQGSFIAASFIMIKNWKQHKCPTIQYYLNRLFKRSCNGTPSSQKNIIWSILSKYKNIMERKRAKYVNIYFKINTTLETNTIINWLRNCGESTMENYAVLKKYMIWIHLWDILWVGKANYRIGCIAGNQFCS